MCDAGLSAHILVDCVQRVCASVCDRRQSLMMHRTIVAPLASYTPRFEDGAYHGVKEFDPDRERAKVQHLWLSDE
jgi:hypothetical protein